MVSGASCWQLGQVIVDCKIIPRCFRFELVSLLGLAKRVHHSTKSRMAPVLDLDPAIETTRAIGPMAMLGGQTLAGPSGVEARHFMRGGHARFSFTPKFANVPSSSSKPPTIL